MPTCERGNVDAVVVFPGRDFFAFTTVGSVVVVVAAVLAELDFFVFVTIL